MSKLLVLVRHGKAQPNETGNLVTRFIWGAVQKLGAGRSTTYLWLQK